MAQQNNPAPPMMTTQAQPTAESKTSRPVYVPEAYLSLFSYCPQREALRAVWGPDSTR